MVLTAFGSVVICSSGRRNRHNHNGSTLHQSTNLRWRAGYLPTKPIRETDLRAQSGVLLGVDYLVRSNERVLLGSVSSGTKIAYL